jgi:hemerythrin superfamily protein
MDAVNLLIEQHRLLEKQFESLIASAGEEARRASLAEVGDHLGVHLASEEEVFYPAVRAQSTKDDLLESLEEHLSLKRLLADLLALQPSDQTFVPKCKVLREQAVHHHKEEEEHLFPRVRVMLDAQELELLGSEMVVLQRRMRHEEAPREVIVEQTDEARKLD